MKRTKLSFPMHEFSELRRLFKKMPKEEPPKPERKIRQQKLKGARRRLAEKHTPTAQHIARTYRSAILSFDERLSATQYGICLAALKYRGKIRQAFTFRQYAERHAIKEIRNDSRAFYRWLKKHTSTKEERSVVNADCEQIDNKDAIASILEAMQGLNPRHQEVLRLFCAGATYAEIATLTGYTECTARRTTNNAIDRVLDIVNQQRS